VYIDVILDLWLLADDRVHISDFPVAAFSLYVEDRPLEAVKAATWSARTSIEY